MSWIHIEDTTPKARKDYECLLCGLPIPKGEIHIARSGFGPDCPEKIRMHHACEEKTRKWDKMNWECHDCQEFRARYFPHNASDVPRADARSSQVTEKP